MASKTLLYRFPSSQSSSPVPDIRHSWPNRHQLHRSQLPLEKEYFEHPGLNRIPAASSIDSLNANLHGPLRVTNENLHPSRGTSPSSSVRCESNGRRPKPVYYRSTSEHVSRINQGTPTNGSCIAEPWQDFDSSAGCGERMILSAETPDSSKRLQASYDNGGTEILGEPRRQTQPMEKVEMDQPSILSPSTSKHAFRKWMRSVRHTSPGRKRSLQVREERWSLDESDGDKDRYKSKLRNRGHQKSSSWSSSGIVTAVKSATASLAGSHAHKRRVSTSNRKSHRGTDVSGIARHKSRDNHGKNAGLADEATFDRARQRRRTIEEIVSSEESYVADLKVLVNVYLTLLESTSNASQQDHVHVNQNIKDILALHEELLSRLRWVMREPDSRIDKADPRQDLRSRHIRWRSQDSSYATTGETTRPVARHFMEVSWMGREKKASTLASQPHEAAEIARVFDRMMTRFFVYEEYGAKYESMLRDMASVSKHIPNWQAYERGIEALARALLPSSSDEGKNRKGLTFEDMLIKPVQRVCKYPLLFADLYKYTPLIDGADSRGEIEKVLCRLREMTQEINKATNDHDMRLRIERSWQLQDLVKLPDVVTAPPSLRILGHAILCGVLHITYRSPQGPQGCFMLCVLFKSYLLIAAPAAGAAQYKVKAIIDLGRFRIEESDNGRGLQCYTALYSWKAVFENEGHLYEMIYCACSAREEEQWRHLLIECSAKEGQKQVEDKLGMPPPYAVMDIDIKPSGEVFRQPNAVDRPLSIQRAATLPRSTSYQVIIKNTSAAKDPQNRNVSPSNSVSRSQSLMASNRVMVLAPKRTERTRMEHQLASVWTRELLPYPGMGGQRGENVIRNSASTIFRRLRGASLSSTFTKQSTSVSSLVDNASENSQDHLPQTDTFSSKKRPALHGSKSLDVSLYMNEQLVAEPGVTQALKRSSSLAGSRLFRNRSRRANREMATPEAGHEIVSRRGSETESVNTIKIKLSAVTGLLTALSGDGKRGWFH